MHVAIQRSYDDNALHKLNLSFNFNPTVVAPYHVEMVVVRIADGKVATIQVHLPRHLLRTVLFHLQTVPATFLVISWLLIFHGHQKLGSTGESPQATIWYDQWSKCKIRGGGTLHSGLGPWQWSCAFPQHYNTLRWENALIYKLEVGERRSLASHYTLTTGHDHYNHYKTISNVTSLASHYTLTTGHDHYNHYKTISNVTWLTASLTIAQ